MRNLNCLRCGSSMVFSGNEKLQLGQTGWILGDIPNLLAGALEVELYYCPECGKLEFFAAGQTESTNRYRDESLPEKQCPACGLSIDFDYPKCPCCGYEF